MEFAEELLSPRERYALKLRSLYAQEGYSSYRMGKFEEYDLYAKNKGFLVSDNVITFTDTNGRLMALKPDVTLSIVKNARNLPEITQRIYYSENVYRVNKEINSYREIMQTGLECFGRVTQDELLEVVLLAARSLQLLADDWILELANLDAMLWQKLQKTEFASRMHLAEQLDVDQNYYDGIVFKGYIRGIPQAVLSGGQYDRLMEKLHPRSRAIGFAVYVDLLERLEQSKDEAGDDFLNVALPKGRLGERVYAMFAQAGYECPELLENTRKLLFENKNKKVRYYWVKPSDVAKYVERGAADLGVAGLDILEEYTPDVEELLDLRTGICRMVVAGPRDFVDDQSRVLRVATKFTNITRKYYQGRGRDFDMIKLHGSIEIAPLLHLSDVIVDIVETGTTLKENNLQIIDEVLPISARLIANKSSCKFKRRQIKALKAALQVQVEGNND